MDGPILLNLLEEQHIPLWSHQRGEKDPLVFGGGPVLTANPEPLAPFLDVVLLGDGEELLPNFIDTIQEIRGLQRSEQLLHLAQIPGIYVPQLYEPKFSNKGELLDIEPINSNVPRSITKQTWLGNTLSYSKIITPDSVWPNIHMVEVARSCPELCRFCLASYLTLPFRSPSVTNELIPAIEKGMKATNRIGLLGASVTQHPEFADLLHWLNQDKFNNIHLSISSIRAATLDLHMAKVLANHGSKSITIAIESGSERMRTVVNKKLREEEIFAAAKYAQEGGLKGLKLYGMVGLPTEEEEDVEATAELLLRLKKESRKLHLTLGVSTFVPKAHTPFQWHGVEAKADKKLKLLSKKLKPKGIELRPESFRWSVLQALISRSDRRLAPVIALVRKENTIGNWKRVYQAIRQGNLSETIEQPITTAQLPSWDEIVHQEWDRSRTLPWEHIQGPVKPNLLLDHQLKALNQKNSKN